MAAAAELPAGDRRRPSGTAATCCSSRASSSAGFRSPSSRCTSRAYLIDVGLDPAFGAWSLAVIGLFNVIGSLFRRLLGGRYPKPIFLCWIYLAARGGDRALRPAPGQPATVLIFSAVPSACCGCRPCRRLPASSPSCSGPHYMGTLLGFVFLSHQVGAFLGVWLGGALYDRLGSYDVVWWLSSRWDLFAAIVHWPIQERPVARAPACSRMPPLMPAALYGQSRAWQQAACDIGVGGRTWLTGSRAIARRRKARRGRQAELRELGIADLMDGDVTVRGRALDRELQGRARRSPARRPSCAACR